MKEIVANLQAVGTILAQARGLAIEYRNLTGRPLGITGEVAEYEAARLLGLELATVRQAGYDVVRFRNGATELLQVKGRCVLNNKPGQRLGRIDTTKEWDGVLLVLLGPDLQPTAIYEAPRQAIIAALEKPGSKSRNVRGALSVSQFRRISTLVWSNKVVHAL